VHATFTDQVVRFDCEDSQAERQLGLLFNGWLMEASSAVPSISPNAQEPAIQFRVSLVETLLSPSISSQLIYSDQAGKAGEDHNLLSVFEDGTQLHIYFGDYATVTMPWAEKAVDEGASITVQLTVHALQPRRLEDIVFGSLAPLLRRRGVYLIHAFAAAKGNKAILLAGESGSGKSTTGLCLVRQGWAYLANDVVFLKEHEGIVEAWPTPGGISLDPTTVELLPHLAHQFTGDRLRAGKQYFPAREIIEDWASPAPVAVICFPRVNGDAVSNIHKLSQSVAIARLMEGSIDRWDRPVLRDHIRLLERLGRQSESYDLSLGRDTEQLQRILNGL